MGRIRLRAKLRRDRGNRGRTKLGRAAEAVDFDETYATQVNV
jgi:hypothetical protein